jgi:hypothetical protein
MIGLQACGNIGNSGLEICSIPISTGYHILNLGTGLHKHSIHWAIIQKQIPLHRDFLFMFCQVYMCYFLFTMFADFAYSFPVILFSGN